MNIFKFLKDKIFKPKPKPVTIVDEELGTFTLDKYGWFENEVDWLGEQCTVSLRYDEASEDAARQALDVFKKIYSDRESLDVKFRKFAAECLTDIVNDFWLEEGAEEITKEQFAARISIGFMWVYADGDYQVFFDDDDMFHEHSIVLEGSIEQGLKNADIWG